jgi:hypothetical protein
MCERVDVFSQVARKATKPYTCSQCFGKIESGERYWRIGVLFDGQWRTYRECGECRKLVDKINVSVPFEEGVPFEGLIEWVCESQDRDLAKELATIMWARGSAYRIRRHVCDIAGLETQPGIEIGDVSTLIQALKSQTQVYRAGHLVDCATLASHVPALELLQDFVRGRLHLVRIEQK